MAELTSNDSLNPELKVERIYTKSVSFDMTTFFSPEKEENIQPEVSLDVKINVIVLKDNLLEVILTLNVTAKANQGLLYYAKVQQAGIFSVTSATEEQKDIIINVICASILYPYACERVLNLSIHAGFPSLKLAPINFEVIYQKNKIEERKELNEEESITAHS